MRASEYTKDATGVACDPRRTWSGEPALKEVLSDPVVTTVMIRDRIRTKDILRLKAVIGKRARAIRQAANATAPVPLTRLRLAAAEPAASAALERCGSG